MKCLGDVLFFEELKVDFVLELLMHLYFVHSMEFLFEILMKGYLLCHDCLKEVLENHLLYILEEYELKD